VKESDLMRIRTRPTRLAGLLLAAALSTPGCFSFDAQPLPGAAGEGTAAPGTLGSFTVRSPRLGNATISPAGCSAGGRQLFLGGDFADPVSGLVARVVFDPLEGPIARVYAAADPYGRSVVLRRASCAVFHASIESTGVWINDVEDFRVSLELDCALEDGTSVHGSASATHCH